MDYLAWATQRHAIAVSVIKTGHNRRVSGTDRISATASPASCPKAGGEHATRPPSPCSLSQVALHAYNYGPSTYASSAKEMRSPGTRGETTVSPRSRRCTSRIPWFQGQTTISR